MGDNHQHKYSIGAKLHSRKDGKWLERQNTEEKQQEKQDKQRTDTDEIKGTLRSGPGP